VIKTKYMYSNDLVYTHAAAAATIVTTTSTINTYEKIFHEGFKIYYVKKRPSLK